EVCMFRLLCLHARWSVLCLLLVPLAAVADLPPPPAAPRKSVADEYHGVKVLDDYRWLEEAGSPAVKKWYQQQNRRTRNFLAGLPARQLIRKRVQELFDGQSAYYEQVTVGEKLIFAVRDGVLVVRTNLDKADDERVLVDPYETLPKQHAHLDFYV